MVHGISRGWAKLGASYQKNETGDLFGQQGAIYLFEKGLVSSINWGSNEIKKEVLVFSKTSHLRHDPVYLSMAEQLFHKQAGNAPQVGGSA